MNNLVGGGCSSEKSIAPERASTNAGNFRNVPGKNAPPGMANHSQGIRPTTPIARKAIKKAF